MEDDMVDWCGKRRAYVYWKGYDQQEMNRCEFEEEKQRQWDERIAVQCNILTNPRFVTFQEWKQSFDLQPTQIKRSIKCWLLCSNRLQTKLPPDVMDLINFWTIYLWFW